MAGLTAHVEGSGGEHIAEEYLLAHGAQILEKNYHAADAEIDLIVQMDDRIVFVEVKARFGNRYGTPGEAITPAKAAKIRKAALIYLREHGGISQRTRFDAILINQEGIKHIPGAF